MDGGMCGALYGGLVKAPHHHDGPPVVPGLPGAQCGPQDSSMLHAFRTVGPIPRPKYMGRDQAKSCELGMGRRPYI
eukprot:341283-Chlamydomonas_euryale.AAC.8